MLSPMQLLLAPLALFASNPLVDADFAATCTTSGIAQVLERSVGALDFPVALTSILYRAEGDELSYVSYNGDYKGPALSSYCEVNLAITSNPATGSVVNTAVLLPSPSAWNGRLLGHGNGGFSGGIVWPALVHSVPTGFAAWSTDTGHVSLNFDGSWALNNEDAMLDFSYRSVHLSVTALKTLVPAFYSARGGKSYWSGCSTGGAQALKAVQKYPHDFDGVVAGSPASYQTHLQPWAIRQSRAMEPVWQRWNDAKVFWQVVGAEVNKQCDHLDGVVDGVIADPRNCHFRPEALACTSIKASSISPPQCLVQVEIDALNTIYRPYVIGEDEYIYPGISLGGEANFHFGVLGSAPIAYPVQYFRYFALNDSNWDYHTLDVDTIRKAHQLDVAELNAVNPDLSAYEKSGGKLIHYFGFGDQNIPPLDSIDYYNSVSSVLSPKGISVDGFYSLFPVPGMAHCATGPGANAFGGPGQAAKGMPSGGTGAEWDVVSSVVEWVEKGTKPQALHSVKWTDDDHTKGKQFERMLCPYPKRAILAAGENPDTVASWQCSL